MLEVQLAACIDACKTYEDTCGDVPQAGDCRLALRECLRWCRRLLAELRSNSPRLKGTVLACSFACEACGECYESLEGESFRRYAAECLACAASCGELAAWPEPVGAGW